jgi:hypothetical protein
MRAKIEEVMNNSEKIENLKTLGLKNSKRFSWDTATLELESIIKELI